MRRRAWAICTTQRKVKVDIGSPLLPEDEPTDAGIVVAAEYDSRDTAFQSDARPRPPRSSTCNCQRFARRRPQLAARRTGHGRRRAVPPRRIWWITLAGGSDLSGDLPADRAFTLGGPRQLSRASNSARLRVGGYWTIGTSYLWNVKDVMPIRNLALYAGVRVVGGAVYDRFDDGRVGGHLWRLDLPHGPHAWWAR